MHCTAGDDTPYFALQRAWAPDYLADWLFGQTDIWVTAAGEVVNPATMDPEHALNTLCFLERVADDLPFPRESLQSKPLYGAIRQRVLDILVPPPETLFVAKRSPEWDGRTHNFRPIPKAWAVYKIIADGSLMEWDAPFHTEAEAQELAEQRNRTAVR